MSKLFRTFIFTIGWLLLFGAPTLKAQIVGVWHVKHNGSNVEIYQKGDLFYGKIVGLKETTDSKTGKPLTDVNNSDPTKRNRPLMGLEIIRNLQYIGNSNWDNGFVYCPIFGKSFDCKITLIDKNTLEITGYWGWSLIGKSYIWTRI